MDLIKEIKYRMSITDLLSKLGLEMNASGYVHSIYKDEKTPSMKIYTEDDTYKCYATDSKRGDVINLYKDFYNLDTSTAVKELAQLCGIEMQTDNRIVRSAAHRQPDVISALEKERNQILKCLSEDELYVYDEMLGKMENPDSNEAHRCVLRHVQSARLHINREIFTDLYLYCQKYKSKEIYKYLLEERKLPESTIEKFKLFTIDNYFQVQNHLSKQFQMDDLVRSGLFKKNKDTGKYYLIFYNHRLIIPYLHKNEPVYLRGRFFDKDGNYHDDKGFKYLGLVNDKLDLNRTKRFFNSDIIANLFTGERLFITEGEFDVMAIDSLGRNAIAIPGASNMPADKYFNQLLNFNISLCMDNDEAGIGLKDRLLTIFNKLNKSVSIKKLPVKDANEFLKVG